MKSLLIQVGLFLVLMSPFAVAQKTKVGFDKSVDFSRYHTYSWPNADSPDMTLRRAAVIGEIDDALKSKGLTRIDKDGDLILSGFGGFGGQQAGPPQDVTLPTFSSMTYPMDTMWTGAPMATGSAVISGSLVLQMADRTTGKLVWQGSVTQKIDMDNKPKSIEKIKAAIKKLVDQYPPKKTA